MIERATRHALVGLVAALATFGAASTAAARSVMSPVPRCSTAHALVAYYDSNIWSFDAELVIRSAGRASLCWQRRTLGPTDQVLSSRSGRSDFRLSPSQMKALVSELEHIGVGRLGPRSPVMQSKWLVYKGKKIPTGASPRTEAGKRALARAEAILDDIVERHSPS
jgi:hypothetical protein